MRTATESLFEMFGPAHHGCPVCGAGPLPGYRKLWQELYGASQGVISQLF